MKPPFLFFREEARLVGRRFLLSLSLKRSFNAQAHQRGQSDTGTQRLLFKRLQRLQVTKHKVAVRVCTCALTGKSVRS